MSKQKKKGPKNLGKTFFRLIKYLTRYKFLLALVILFIVISSVSMVSGSYLLKPLINNYILPGDFVGVVKMLTLLGIVFGLGALASYGYSRIMVHIAQESIRDIRKELFDKMQTLPVSYFDWNNHGDLMSLYTNDIDNINEALNNSITNIIASSLTFISTLVMMFVLSPILGALTVCGLLAMVFLTKKLGAKSKYYFGLQQKNIGKVNGYVEEMMEGQKVIKVFCHEEKSIEDFKKHNEELRLASTGAQTFAGMIMPAFGNLSHINYAISCCIGGILTISGVLDIGTLVSYLQYSKQVTNPIAQVSQQMNVILAALAGAERIFEVLDKDAELDEGKITLVYATKNSEGKLEESNTRTNHWAWKKEDGSLIELKGDVKFNDVVFGYYPEKTILKNISLYAKPGQKIAFVGSTGAGKTTITNLINRFYEIQSGTITYDGLDIHDIKKDDLRKSLGIVLQDTHLFTGTIADNIRYGRLDATDEEVIVAAKLANADTFIKHLPHGYNTVLTGDGEGLSQGQRQLLAIARAAVANPPVLILDEATSSIDTRTEKLIQEGMDKLMEDRTVFVIAHRLSTIKNSDAIMVLEQGEIIERGDHKDLIEKKGRYYQLYTGKKELD
ncbi:MAG: ABC transporter ATP-binding protein [Clostridium sp.]|nr:ABC transporter ATP-binding protein [Clostridium sp.]